MMRGLILFSCLLTGCSAANTGSKSSPVSRAIVSVAPVPEVELLFGDTTTVTLSVTVANGYHVQANPAGGEFLIPLEVELDGADGVEVGVPQYPDAIPYRLHNSEDVLLTYHGTFAVKVPIKPRETGLFNVTGKLSYQACDAKMCLFPSSLPISFRVRVAESSTPEKIR